MAQQIKLKRSAVSGKVPTTAQLQTGEIAINTADGKLFFKRDDSTVQTIVTTNALITGSLSINGPITGSDTQINDWGSVSASLASINAQAVGIPTLDQVTGQGATTTNDISTGAITVDSYTILESGKVTVNNNALGAVGGTYSGTTYAGFVMDYVIYDALRENQRTGTLMITANSSEAVYSENVTTDIGNTDGAEITVTIGSGNFRANLDNKTGSTMYVTYNIKLLKV
jgi:hypothetical protein